MPFVLKITGGAEIVAEIITETAVCLISLKIYTHFLTGCTTDPTTCFT